MIVKYEVNSTNIRIVHVDADESSTSKHGLSKDDTFREFRRLCTMLAGEPSYNAKTKIIADVINTGASGGKHLKPTKFLKLICIPYMFLKILTFVSYTYVSSFRWLYWRSFSVSQAVVTRS